MICTIANKRKTNIEELQKLTNLDVQVLNELLSNGIAKNIITEGTDKQEKFYTLSSFGEKQLELMNATITGGWTEIRNAVNNKDVDRFVNMVQENEEWIKYLRYTKMISVEDADFVIDTYQEILRSRKKKKADIEVTRLQNDMDMKRTNALREQQWKFDDQNYEITREHNEYVDTNYYDGNY